ncbi:hypothetical protein [Streptomyces sp. cg36]|uniref:hypothetical protein n=1 Tax=Streptomyces sp. cg36 TaxID=3238798 RepID=UPI0034E227BB
MTATISRPARLPHNAKHAIIISPHGSAHLVGCDHLCDSVISAPKFGWVSKPAPGQWDTISADQPLSATTGADITAARRCKTCQSGATR